MKPSIVLFASVTATVAAANPKAIPFGYPAPVQALRPRMEYVKYLNDHNITETSYSKDPKPHIDLSAKRTEEIYDDDDDDGEDEDEDEDEDDHTGFSLNFLNPLNLFKPEKRATRDCGVFKLDCANVRSVCNNACYYQNCVKAGQTVRYQDFGGDKIANKENRVDAGTTVSAGTPCRNMPLSQKMYDQWPDWDTVDPNLQTDEWPMAAFVQPQFSDLAAGTVRNSLRCITNRDNGKGGQEYKYFRRRQANYNTDNPGKYANLRTCDTPKVFTGDETFTVEFDLSGLSQTEIDEVVPYCKPNPDCANDGRQFHLSALRYVSAAGNAGQMEWPYDLETMNNYKLTGEDNPIESFQVIVKITGDDRQEYDATVNKYRNGQTEKAGSANSNKLATDQTLTVKGLPRDLKITPKSDSAGSRLDFVYGDPGSDADKLAFFSFNTNDYGFDNQFDNENHFYCKLTTLTDSDGDTYGQQYECWFPGW